MSIHHKIYLPGTIKCLFHPAHKYRHLPYLFHKNIEHYRVCFHYRLPVVRDVPAFHYQTPIVNMFPGVQINILLTLLVILFYDIAGYLHQGLKYNIPTLLQG